MPTTNPLRRLSIVAIVFVASTVAIISLADAQPTPSDVEVLVVPGVPEETKGRVDCYVTPPISKLSIDISLSSGKLPTDAAARCATTTQRIVDRRVEEGWMMTEQHWAATHMRHRPLYFEEVNAERYGYTPSYLLQPIISAGRFFATIPALPYKMAVDCPSDCIYTLGHYRPGSCVPRRWHRLPLRLGAGAVEAGFIAGMILLLP